MSCRLAVLCILQFLVWGANAFAEDAPVAECDKYFVANKIIPAAAIPACKVAVEQYPNNTGFIFQLGVAYADSGDWQAAIAQYRKAADRGLAPAQLKLGAMYDFGHGVPQNYEQAAAWYRKAAEQGLADAQNNLGSMYAKGHGVPQDYEQSIAWYRKAADQGLAAAQYNLGFRYYVAASGIPEFVIRGVERSKYLVLAYMWLSASAAQGDPDAERVKQILEDRMGSERIAEVKKQARAEWDQIHRSR